MSEHPPEKVPFGEVLPEQTSDDMLDERELDDDVADLDRFVEERPPHHRE